MPDNPLVSIEKVTFTYPGAEAPALRDVSLTLDRGDFVAIIGGNGCGKSTLCKTLNGLIPHYYVGDFHGSVTVDGRSTREHKVADLSRYVGYVYQDFDNQLVRPTVLDDASFAPLNYGHRDYLERGRRALQLAGLTVHPKEFIWQLSGGQKHLLALAGALSLDPDLLIVDEPVAQLDPQHARQIYGVLSELNEKWGKTIVVIEHHTEFIADYCKHVVLMDQGRVVWKKPTAEALTQVEALASRQLFPPQVTQAAHRAMLEGLVSAGRYPVTLEEGERYFSGYRQQMADGRAAMPVRKERHSGRRAIVELERVEVVYPTVDRGEKKVLHAVDLDIYEGDRIALVGNNGSGKSSLMRLLTGTLRPKRGAVRVLGVDTRTVPPEKLAGTVAYICQNPEDMFIADTIRKDVEFFMKSRRMDDCDARADEILDLFHLTELQQRDGRLLSGGQQRRASLAIGVAMQPSVMLLDEPTASLDIATRKEVMRMMQRLEGRVKTVVVATHDMQLAAEWANRIVVMHEGSVIHDGDRESVFTNRELLATAGLSAPQILELSRRMGMAPLAHTVAEFVSCLAAGREEGAEDGIRSQAAP